MVMVIANSCEWINTGSPVPSLSNHLRNGKQAISLKFYLAKESTKEWTWLGESKLLGLEVVKLQRMENVFPLNPRMPHQFIAPTAIDIHFTPVDYNLLRFTPIFGYLVTRPSTDCWASLYRRLRGHSCLHITSSMAMAGNSPCSPTNSAWYSHATRRLWVCSLPSNSAYDSI